MHHLSKEGQKATLNKAYRLLPQMLDLVLVFFCPIPLALVLGPQDKS
jgi:hypothetical protein